MVTTTWTCTNAVYHFTFDHKVKMKNISCCKDIFYEPEIFPAILLSKWNPAHVTLFSNGKGVITGVIYKKTAIHILAQVLEYLYSMQ